ncbi:MAG: histidinol-phosphate transaminase, partial [Candidatus Acidiferrales bacterium]
RVRLRDVVERLPAYSAPSEGRAGKLRLDFNENTVGCSPKVRAALVKMTREQIAIYPEYEATSRRLARFFRVGPEELLITNGADDALHIVTDAFLERGASALVVDPTFPMYDFYAGIAGARMMRLRYDGAMQFPLAAVCRALARRPRVFFLANPNNPTGTVVTPHEMQAVLAAANGTLVVMDEAYWEFSGVTALGWIRRYPNLVVIRTFSKAAGLAGLRIGCLFANRELMGAFRRVQPPFAVNAAALLAADAAVRDTAYVRSYVREVRAAREVLSTVLTRLGIRVFPSGANFLLADFGLRAPAILRALLQRKILLRERRDDFGRVGFVRITVGTRDQTRRLIRALERLWLG